MRSSCESQLPLKRTSITLTSNDGSTNLWSHATQAAPRTKKLGRPLSGQNGDKIDNLKEETKTGDNTAEREMGQKHGKNRARRGASSPMQQSQDFGSRGLPLDWLRYSVCARRCILFDPALRQHLASSRLTLLDFLLLKRTLSDVIGAAVHRCQALRFSSSHIASGLCAGPDLAAERLPGHFFLNRFVHAHHGLVRVRMSRSLIAPNGIQ